MEKMILIVDEQTQGGRAEYENVFALKEAVNELLDDRVLEVKVTKRAPEVGAFIKTGNVAKSELPKELNILGVIYKVEEVEVVNKAEPRKGEINFLTNEIRIDKNMPKSLKEQVLMHEIMHAVFDLLGFSELGEDEEKVQSIATALHHVFTTQIIFSS